MKETYPASLLKKPILYVSMFLQGLVSVFGLLMFLIVLGFLLMSAIGQATFTKVIEQTPMGAFWWVKRRAGWPTNARYLDQDRR